VIGEEGEVLVFDAEDLPDEDEAAALARKPLDEILGLSSEVDVIDDEEGVVHDGESAFEPEVDDEERVGEGAAEHNESEPDAVDAPVREAGGPAQEDSVPEQLLAEANAPVMDEGLQQEDSDGREPAGKPDSDSEPATSNGELPADGTEGEEVAADGDRSASESEEERDALEAESGGEGQPGSRPAIKTSAH
jgi:hypothetical protein